MVSAFLGSDGIVLHKWTLLKELSPLIDLDYFRRNIYHQDAGLAWVGRRACFKGLGRSPKGLKIAYYQSPCL